MKYRIIEIPKVDSEPLFYIQAWGHRLSSSIWSNKTTGCWCCVNEAGYPINKGYELTLYDDYLGSFKSLEKAKEYLESIIEYRKKEIKTVFETEI